MKATAPVQKNKKYEITITDLGSNGEGIGKIDQFAIFVEGVLPGEKVEICIVKVKKSFAYGKLLEIKEASPDRVIPMCCYAKQCGGCQIQHISYEGQLIYKTKKVKDSLERIGGLKNSTVLPAIGMKQPWQYRNKAQYPVGEINGLLQIGFFAQRSHKIVDINTCCIQHNLNDEILKIVREYIEKYNIKPYREETHTGILRHVLVKTGFETGEIMVCFIINGDKLPYSEYVIEKLKKIQGMTSIVLNQNKAKTNVILGNKTITIWGSDFITDYIGKVKFKISPLSFFQVNPEQTKVLYQKVLEFADLKGEETVIDLYCGIGTISLLLAQKAKTVYGVEIVPEAVEDAKENAVLNNIKNVTFEAGAVEEMIPRLYSLEKQKADVVVVDPPRKGCERSVLDTIIAMKPQKLIYVSCDPATLARDLSILSENGFQVEVVQPVDLFPMTVHVETVVSLSLKGNTSKIKVMK